MYYDYLQSDRHLRVAMQAQVPLEHPWFTPGAPPVVLGAGRLRLQKDFPTLVRAFARARAVREMRLMILGDKTSERKPV
jgi:glycosyltransferase involved in cell wall biosynthesis